MSEVLNKAIALHKQNKLDAAEKLYHQVLAEDFDCADALYLLGTIYVQRNMVGLASNLFKQCLLTKKDHFEAWNNLGNCYKAANKETDAEACFKTALEIKARPEGSYADIYNNLATLHINSGAPAEGVPFVDKALELDPNHPDAKWNKALLHLEQGEYGAGFDLYPAGFETKNRLNRSYGGSHPLWDGKKTGTLVVWGEQGIGDELMFASMLPEALKLADKVIFDCHPRLADIFKASFPEATVYGTRKDAFIEWPYTAKIDAKIAIGDLGRFFRRNAADFSGAPYLKADPKRVEHYRKKLAKLGNRPKVGISWTGGYLKTRKDFRTVPLELWAPVLEQDVDIISLQYTPEGYKTVAEVEDRFDCRIYHWPSAVQAENYMETAALVEALDLIITVNTSIHHLAGGLGKPCWTLTPKGKAWRYWSADDKNVPWYGSVSLYEQEKQGEWGQVMDRVTKDLKGFLKGNVVE